MERVNDSLNTPSTSSVTTAIGRLWRADAPLTAAGMLLLGALGFSLVGLWADPRIVTGAPVWLKPAKFALSTAIFTLTLASIFTYLPAWTRLRRVAGWTTAVALVLEVALIDVQAWRGTTSHFNIGTPFDAVVFGVMGVTIVVQTLMSVAVAVALWRQPFADRARGWALRLGMSITIVGAMVGGLMPRPTAEQMAEARISGRMTVAGAHTIGAPDGGAGAPGTGWSLTHGDLRVPHFLGLHAMQALPLLALAFHRRRWVETTQVRLVVIAAGSYMALFVILLWQALRGISVFGPDAATVMAFSIWLALTATVMWLVTSSRRPVQRSRTGLVGSL